MDEKYKFLTESKKSKLSTQQDRSKYRNPMKTSPISKTNVYISSIENANKLLGSITFPIVKPVTGGNIGRFLDNLNTCHTLVTNLVPRIVYFADEAYGSYTNISDGCNDMYDGGNLYDTNHTQLFDNIRNGNTDYDLSILYTHTQAQDIYNCNYTDPPMDGILVEDQSYFGEGSKYFTNMYPGMFIIAASNIDITEFSITGDIGSDGNGTDNVYAESSDYPGWTIFTKTNYNNNDPSINHIIAVSGDVSGVTQLYDNEALYDDHCLQGLNSQNSAIICIVVATEAGTGALTSQEALTIGNKIIDIYTTGC